MPIELRGGKKEAVDNKYAPLGLKENPFLSAPVATYDATDVRLGKIFSRETHRLAVETIERRWIGQGRFAERLRIGFLWAQSTDLTDKGMGKSAVVFHIVDRVNQGWGQQYFPDRKVAAIYVYAGVDWNQLGFVCIDALRRMDEIGIIREVVKVLRFMALTDANHPALATLSSEAELEKLMDDTWLTENNIDMANLTQKVAGRLIAAGVGEPGLADAVANLRFIDYLKAKRSDRQLTLPPRASDWRLTKESLRLFFDQAMRIMAAGNFDACYLFVDDVENIIKDPRTNLRQFASELGGNLFRNDVYSNKEQFLSIFLTTHTQAALKLGKEWREAGYQTRAELHTQSQNSVMIGRLTDDGAIRMIEEYLAYYRIEPAAERSLAPFDEAGVKYLAELSKYHPAQLLRNCHHYLLQAAEQGLDLISLDFLKEQQSVVVEETTAQNDDSGFVTGWVD